MMSSGLEVATLLGSLALLVAGAAVAMVACVIVGCSVRACRDVLAYRRDQKRRFGELRIRRMLPLLGISHRRYFRKSLITTIEQQLHRCGRCPNAEACDDALHQEDASQALAFCPNFNELVRLQPGKRSSGGT